jgi:hypothetical protein
LNRCHLLSAKKPARFLMFTVCHGTAPALGTFSRRRKKAFFMNKRVILSHSTTIKTTIMDAPDFPNGFASWQKTHFEVVEVLVFIRDLEEGKQPGNFVDYLDRSATQELYDLALDLTNKYEEQSKGKTRERTLFDEIEEFVWKEVNRL